MCQSSNPDPPDCSYCSRSFAHAVDSWVLGALWSAPDSFVGLLGSLPGVFPTEVITRLDRLSRGNLVDSKLTESLLRDAKGEGNSITKSYCSRLPMPHALDYEWRFSDAAAERILQTCISLKGADQPLAFVGAPSLAVQVRNMLYQPPFVVMDSNQEMLEFLGEPLQNAQIICCDIARDPLPADVKVGVAVVDPPWYPEFFRSFSWACSHVCTLNGYIVVSLPPIGTRPHVVQERHEYIGWMEQLGVKLLEVCPGALPYATPLFERNCLRSHGIRCSLQEWRRGDMAVFQKIAEPMIPREKLAAPDSEWIEERIGRVRVRLKGCSENKFADPQLVSIIAGDVLPSVSRRDKLRPSIDVWTSGHRVFRCSGTGILRVILRALRGGRAPLDLVEERLHRTLTGEEAAAVHLGAEQAVALLEREREEHERYS